MNPGQKNSYPFASQNNYYTSERSALGDATQSNLMRYDNPDGLKAMGKRFIAFSIINDNHGNPIDYDKDYFGTKDEAKDYIDTMKIEDPTHYRTGFYCRAEDEITKETQLINLLNTGYANSPSSDYGALPYSDNEEDLGGPFYAE